MDAILRDLGGILLRAVPTFLLVIFLHFYLKGVFFGPMQQVLRKRYEATMGARKMADQSLALAAQKTAEFEAALRAAKAEVYHVQEQLHKQLQEQHATELLAARKQAEALIAQAKADLASDVEAAKAGLGRESELLANQIAESILRRSTA
jgi:F-type H+-transporting ATPase subunit b